MRVSGGLNHAWPGGRRQRGESFEGTAAREVEEETGWLVRAGSFRFLGWLHLVHLGPTAGPSLARPDFCQVVGSAAAD